MADTKQLVERANKAFNAHDLDALKALSSDSSELTTPTGTVRGTQAISDYNKNWFDAFPDAKVTNNRVIVSGDIAVVEAVFEGTQTGTLKSPVGDIAPTGKKLRGEVCGITRYQGEINAETRLYFDQVDLLTQLGLMPQPA